MMNPSFMYGSSRMMVSPSRMMISPRASSFGYNSTFAGGNYFY